MKDTLDEGMIPGKSTKRAKRALIMLGWSVFCYFVIVIAGGLIFGSHLSVPMLTGIAVLMGLLAAFFSFYGLLLSIKAFRQPKEKGVLKYLALVSNGLLSLLFGAVVLANALDIWRHFFM